MRLRLFFVAGMIGLASFAFDVKSAKATVYAFDNFQDPTETNSADESGWANGLDGWAYDGTVSGGEYTASAEGATRQLATPIAPGTVWYAVTLSTTTPVPVPSLGNNYALAQPGDDSGSGSYQPIEIGYDTYFSSAGPGWYSTGAPAITEPNGQPVTMLTEINTVTGETMGWGAVGSTSSLSASALGMPLFDETIPGYVDETINMDYISGNSQLNIEYVSLASSAADAIGQSSSVPEPASLSLLGVGSLALLGRRRRRA
jgi:hypothetical protein